MKKLLVFIISLTLVISAFVIAASGPNEAIQVITGKGVTFKPVNIIQYIRSLLR
ncbi:MAG: hypothetical protein PHW77_01600 [Eubacteriales bacterium]|nr:hypothetical protein [Eubacteriales bacterium]